MEGMKYYRDRVYAEQARKGFPKEEEERAKIIKKTISLFDIAVII